MKKKDAVIRRMLETDDTDPFILPRAWLVELLDEVEKLRKEDTAWEAHERSSF